jgi:hypothetical protein
MPSDPNPTLDFLLRSVGIPEINQKTVMHLFWRANMLMLHAELTSVDPDYRLGEFPTEITPEFFNEYMGYRAQGVTFRTHRDFCKVMLTPPWNELTRGAAGDSSNDSGRFEPHDMTKPCDH